LGSFDLRQEASLDRTQGRENLALFVGDILKGICPSRNAQGTNEDR
jgi:hypothetical protein